MITSQQAEVVQPWHSRKRRACSGAGPSSDRSNPELQPVLGPVPLRESDEKEHKNHARLTKAAKRVHFKDGVLHADVAIPAQGLCRMRLRSPWASARTTAC